MTVPAQSIRMRRGDDVVDAEISWRSADRQWIVRLESAAVEPVEEHAFDAFEALCLVRDRLEPLGWRIGVAGAQSGVWPSGMARDQGGGLRAYRMTEEGVGGLVDTFDPVDPATVTTVAAQRAEADRLYDAIRRRGVNGGVR
ncbi:hypothetical protein [Microbacterium sp. 179-I 3D3 NHS]|uniref:hypothetical protein n=1 Tax=unclassified Microbacterium TaxID=2609290 RepID=UPI0039A21CF5